MSPKVEACCSFMKVLLETDSQCNVTLSNGKLVSCDDYGDRLPPLNFCPWCRKEIAQDVLSSS